MEEEPEALPGYEELVQAYPADPQIPSESEQEEEVMSQEEGETAQEKELPLEEGFSAAIESRDLRLGKGQRFTFRGETYEIRDLAGPHADGSGDAAHGAQYLIAVNISETPKATSPYALEYYGDWASYLMEDAGFLVHDGRGEGPFSYGYTSPLDYGKPNVSAGDIVLFGENRYTVRSADSQSARIELKEITDGRDEGRELTGAYNAVITNDDGTTETATIGVNVNSPYSYLYVDCDMEDAYNGSANCNQYINAISGGMFPRCGASASGFLASVASPNSGARMLIYPRWWTI